MALTVGKIMSCCLRHRRAYTFHTGLPEIPIACIGEMGPYKSRVARVLLTETVGGRPRTRPLPAGGWEHSA